MADRKDFFFRQLVGEAFMDAAFDDMENADLNFAVDIGAIGIISGLVATQHAPTPDLTIDLTGPGTAYDQAGRRMFVPTATSGLDCSQDEDGNPTAVTTPGNERWCSIQLRFDRTLASPEVDGNGVTVYTDQDESFELAVVRAGEFAIGTNTKPALPADGRLVCDFRLENGDTQIFNGEIYIDRRQDFQIFSAAQIPVTPGSLPWTFLSPATNDVQATLDFIDQRILRTDGSRQLTENLVPDAAARDLGASGNEWDLFLEKLTPSATATVDGNLIPETTGNDLGSTTGPKRWSLFADLVNLDGNLVTSAGSRVLGNLIPSAGTELLGTTGATNQWGQLHFTLGTCYTSLLPDATGKALGSAGAQFDIHTRNTTVYNSLKTSADGNAFGDATNRFAAFLSAMTYYGAIAGTFQFGSAQTIKQMIHAHQNGVNIGAWTAANGNYQEDNSAGASILLIYFTPLHGSTLDQVDITWYQATGTTVSCQIESVTKTGTAASIGASKVISSAGSTVTDTIASSLGHTVDLATYDYRVKVNGAASSVVARAYAIEPQVLVTDILKAVLYRAG